MYATQSEITSCE